MSFEALQQPTFEGSPLALALHRSARIRQSVAAATNCYRLHDAQADAVESAVIERYADFAVLGTYGQRATQRSHQIAQALLELGARGVYLKTRTREDPRRRARTELAPPLPVAGDAAPFEFEVFEHDRRFLVRLMDGLSTGLFLDQRDNRSLLQRECSKARVLNLFCYTGSFSVAAGLGNAASVVSVDASGAALRRAHQNLQLNGLDPKAHRLLKSDAASWLRRAVRRGDAFDWIVVDPPSFGTGDGVFRVASDYPELVANCIRLLAPQGRMLAVVNHRGTRERDFHHTLQRAAQRAGRTLAELTPLPLPLDCPPGPAPDLATKSALVKVE